MLSHEGPKGFSDYIRDYVETDTVTEKYIAIKLGRLILGYVSYITLYRRY